MRKQNKKRKNIIISMIFTISLTLILFFGWFYFIRCDFKIKNYSKKSKAVYEIVNYGSEFKNNLDVTYGSKLLGYHKVKNIKLINDINIDTNKLKTFKLIYKVKYKNEEKTIKKIIDILDIEGPSINVKEKTVNVCPDSKKYNIEYQAIDNYDGNVTEKVKKEIIDNYLVLSVTDSNKNKTVKKIKISYKDQDKPIITLNGNNTISLLVGESYKEQGASAIDNCDGDISSNINIDNNIDINKPGDYQVSYQVLDKAGNTEKVIRNIKVIPKNNVNSSSKVIYLTFDDGPGAYTNQLLDVLKKYNVKATFFVTNQYSNYINLIKREHEEGHTVAIHSYTHRYYYIYSNLNNYFTDLDNMNEVIKKYTGSYSKLVRLPGGSSNTVSRQYSKGIMTSIINELERRGYSYFDWNCVSGDAGGTTSTSVVVSNVTNCMRTNKALIVLQHDVKQFSVNAVEDIIKNGLAMGYSFQALSANSFTVHQKINN